MIEVLPESDRSRLEERFSSVGLTPSPESMAMVARSGGEELGFCLFDLSADKLTVRFLTPENDLALADGILRSTLHVGVNREILNADYADTANEEIFKKLGFLTETPHALNVEKLFQSCSCGK